MKKIIFLFIFAFTMSIAYPIEIQIGLFTGLYQKDNPDYKQLYGNTDKIFGSEFDIYFSKFAGIYLEGMKLSSKGETLTLKKELDYNEIQITFGMRPRINLIRLSPFIGINLYIKIGGTYILTSETLMKTVKFNNYGINLGLGLNLWIRNIGIAIDYSQLLSIDKTIVLEEIDLSTKMDTNGKRFIIKVSLRY